MKNNWMRFVSLFMALTLVLVSGILVTNKGFKASETEKTEISAGSFISVDGFEGVFEVQEDDDELLYIVSKDIYNYLAELADRSEDAEPMLHTDDLEKVTKDSAEETEEVTEDLTEETEEITEGTEKETEEVTEEITEKTEEITEDTTTTEESTENDTEETGDTSAVYTVESSAVGAMDIHTSPSSMDDSDDYRVYLAQLVKMEISYHKVDKPTEDVVISFDLNLDDLPAESNKPDIAPENYEDIVIDDINSLGESVALPELDSWTQIKELDKTYEREVYFVGWAKTKDAETGETVLPSEGITSQTLYAVWEADVTIDYDYYSADSSNTKDYVRMPINGKKNVTTRSQASGEAAKGGDYQIAWFATAQDYVPAPDDNPYEYAPVAHLGYDILIYGKFIEYSFDIETPSYGFIFDVNDTENKPAHMEEKDYIDFNEYFEEYEEYEDIKDLFVVTFGEGYLKTTTRNDYKLHGWSFDKDGKDGYLEVGNTVKFDLGKTDTDYNPDDYTYVIDDFMAQVYAQWIPDALVKIDGATEFDNKPGSYNKGVVEYAPIDLPSHEGEEGEWEITGPAKIENGQLVIENTTLNADNPKVEAKFNKKVGYTIRYVLDDGTLLPGKDPSVIPVPAKKSNFVGQKVDISEYIPTDLTYEYGNTMYTYTKNVKDNLYTLDADEAKNVIDIIYTTSATKVPYRVVAVENGKTEPIQGLFDETVDNAGYPNNKVDVSNFTTTPKYESKVIGETKYVRVPGQAEYHTLVDGDVAANTVYVNYQIINKVGYTINFVEKSNRSNILKLAIEESQFSDEVVDISDIIEANQSITDFDAVGDDIDIKYNYAGFETGLAPKTVEGLDYQLTTDADKNVITILFDTNEANYKVYYKDLNGNEIKSSSVPRFGKDGQRVSATAVDKANIPFDDITDDYKNANPSLKEGEEFKWVGTANNDQPTSVTLDSNEVKAIVLYFEKATAKFEVNYIKLNRAGNIIGTETVDYDARNIGDLVSINDIDSNFANKYAKDRFVYKASYDNKYTSNEELTIGADSTDNVINLYYVDNSTKYDVVFIVGDKDETTLASKNRLDQIGEIGERISASVADQQVIELDGKKYDFVKADDIELVDADNKLKIYFREVTATLEIKFQYEDKEGTHPLGVKFEGDPEDTPPVPSVYQGLNAITGMMDDAKKVGDNIEGGITTPTVDGYYFKRIEVAKVVDDKAEAATASVLEGQKLADFSDGKPITFVGIEPSEGEGGVEGKYVITVTYAKIPTVTIIYVDENGNPIPGVQPDPIPGMPKDEIVIEKPAKVGDYEFDTEKNTEVQVPDKVTLGDEDIEIKIYYKQPSTPSDPGTSGTTGTPETPAPPTPEPPTPEVPEGEIPESIEPIEPIIPEVPVEEEVPADVPPVAVVVPVTVPVDGTVPVAITTTGDNGEGLTLTEITDVETALANQDLGHLCNLLYFLILLVTSIILYNYFRNTRKHQERIFEIRKELGEDDPYRKQDNQ